MIYCELKGGRLFAFGEAKWISGRTNGKRSDAPCVALLTSRLRRSVSLFRASFGTCRTVVHVLPLPASLPTCRMSFILC